MRTSTILISLLLLVLPFEDVPAQDDNVESCRYRVMRTSGYRFESCRGILTPRGIESMSSGHPTVIVPRDEIRVLERYAGHYGTAGMLIGAGTGLAFGLLMLSAAESEAASDPYKEVDHAKAGLLVATFAVGGAVGGWAIGFSTKRWERVSLKTDSSFAVVLGGGKVSLVFSF